MKNSCVDIEDVIVGDEGIKGLCQEFYEVFWWSVRHDEVTPNVIKQLLAEVEKVLLDKFDLVDVSKAKEMRKMNVIRYQEPTKEIHVIGDAHISNYDIDHILQKTKEAICEVLTIEDISPEIINYIAEQIKEGLNERTVQNWIDDFVDAQKTKEMRKNE